MTGTDVITEAQLLYQEKGLEYTGEHLQLLQDVSQYLAVRGIFVNREVLDFAIDVLRVKNILGLNEVATQDELSAARETMVEWLEALGWRRDWFTQPLQE